MQHILYFLLPYLLLFSCLGTNSYAETAINDENTRNHSEQLYQEGQAAIQRGEWDEALIKLKLLNIRYDQNLYWEQAKLSMVFCYKQKKDYRQALQDVNDFIKKHAHSELLETALKMKIEIEQQMVLSNTASNNAGWAMVGKFFTGMTIAQLILLLF